MKFTCIHTCEQVRKTLARKYSAHDEYSDRDLKSRTSIEIVDGKGQGVEGGDHSSEASNEGSTPYPLYPSPSIPDEGSTPYPLYPSPSIPDEGSIPYPLYPSPSIPDEGSIPYPLYPSPSIPDEGSSDLIVLISLGLKMLMMKAP
jgi:hypothetical protein